MASRNERLVVITLETAAKKMEFVKWPLHITIVPWFHSVDEQKLDEVLIEVASRHAVFEARVGSLEYFGRKDKVAVNLVEDEGELDRLHQDVFSTLERNGFSIHQKDHLGEKYKPHITHQESNFLPTGHMLLISKYSLVRQLRLKKTGLMVKSIVKDYALK